MPRSVVRIHPESLILLSSAVERTTVNRLVPGSNPGEGVVIIFIMTKPTKDDILDMLEQNEYDYHVLPHYGLISDWYVRYWELHNLIYTYINDESEH